MIYVVSTIPEKYSICVLDFELQTLTLSTHELYCSDVTKDVISKHGRVCIVIDTAIQGKIDDPDGMILIRSRSKTKKNESIDEKLHVFWPHLRGLGGTAERLFGPRWRETHFGEIEALLFAIQYTDVKGWNEPRVSSPLSVDTDTYDGLDMSNIVKCMSEGCLTEIGKRTFANWISNPMKDVHSIVTRSERISDCYERLEEIATKVARADDVLRAFRRLLSKKNLQCMETFIADVTVVSSFAYDIEIVQYMNGVLSSFRKCGVGNLWACVDDIRADEYNGLSRQLEVWSRLCRMRSSVSVKSSVIDDGGCSGAHILVSTRKKAIARDINFVPMKTGMRASNEEIDALCERMSVLREEIETCTYSKVESFRFDDVSSKMFKMLENAAALDCERAHAIFAKNHAWTKPVIVEDQVARFALHQMRHPIVEKCSKEPFVSNDVSIEGNVTGVIVHGVNSCGKSVLLKTVALCVLLAQCGFHVPAKRMTLVPFHRIVMQVPCRDNISECASSFVVEMQGLSSMLRSSGPNTLVIADEMTRGTEIESSKVIFGAAVKLFQERGARFLMTTHLRGLKEIFDRCGVNDSKIRTCHLACRDKVFSRTLAEGEGVDDGYGVSIACSVIKDPRFALLARNALCPENCQKVQSLKQSRYNKHVSVGECAICGAQASETHHIVPQKDAKDERKTFFPSGKHVHARSNLVGLCNACHVAVHLGKIHIDGYESTWEGIAFKWTTN